jgi:hypothetical protein
MKNDENKAFESRWVIYLKTFSPYNIFFEHAFYILQLNNPMLKNAQQLPNLQKAPNPKLFCVFCKIVDPWFM